MKGYTLLLCLAAASSPRQWMLDAPNPSTLLRVRLPVPENARSQGCEQSPVLFCALILIMGGDVGKQARRTNYEDACFNMPLVNLVNLAYSKCNQRSQLGDIDKLSRLHCACLAGAAE